MILSICSLVTSDPKESKTTETDVVATFNLLITMSFVSSAFFNWNLGSIDSLILSCKFFRCTAPVTEWTVARLRRELRRCK